MESGDREPQEWHSAICDPASREPGGSHEPGLCMSPVNDRLVAGVAVWAEQGQGDQEITMVAEVGMSTLRCPVSAAREQLRQLAAWLDRIPGPRHPSDVPAPA